MLFNSALDTVYLSSINSLRKSYSDLIDKPIKLNRLLINFLFLFIIFMPSNIIVPLYRRYFVQFL